MRLKRIAESLASVLALIFVLWCYSNRHTPVVRKLSFLGIGNPSIIDLRNFHFSPNRSVLTNSRIERVSGIIQVVRADGTQIVGAVATEQATGLLTVNVPGDYEQFRVKYVSNHRRVFGSTNWITLRSPWMVRETFISDLIQVEKKPRFRLQNGRIERL